MFETSRRTHPLHTFRFWFFVLAAGAITVAWKCDLLPVRIGPAETGELAEETFIDIDPPDESRMADSDVELPFTHDDSLNMPTITPATRTQDAAAARQTAELDRGSLYTDQSEPHLVGNAPPQHSEPASGLFADGGQTAAAGTMPAQSTPATSAADDFASSSSIVQTNATSTAYESAPFAPPRESQVPDATAEEPNAPAAVGVDFTQIDQLLASGHVSDEIDAHRQLSTMYWQQPELRDTLRERIDTLAQRIYFQSSRHYMEPYEVQPGEMLQNIAKNYEVSWQYLAKLNRVDPRRVRAGQRLKVIKGPFSAIVDLSDYELTIHAHGYFVTRYPVGIGKDGSSPIGKFAVLEKLVDPTYYGPDGVVDHDDPANPLGERWIDIGNSFGIHGTIDPASIGKNESQGCIRLHNDDVEAVYDLLTIGSEVVIRP